MSTDPSDPSSSAEDERRVAHFVGAMLLAGLVLVAAGIFYAVSALLDPHTAATGMVLAAGIAVAVGLTAWALLERSVRRHEERSITPADDGDGLTMAEGEPGGAEIPLLDRGISEMQVR